MGVYRIRLDLDTFICSMVLVSRHHKKETIFSNADNAVENKIVAFELPAVSAERELLAA
jgi:hypothetical protein